MSKKELLKESEIRRFMKLANLEPLTKNVISEMGLPPSRPVMEVGEEAPAMTPDASMDAPPADMDMGGEEVEIETDSTDPEKKDAFEAAVKALADAMGISVEIEGQEEHDIEDGEEMHDLESDSEDDVEMDTDTDDEEDDEEDEEEELEEKKYTEQQDELEEKRADKEKQLSEDELIETVLKRVTARLVSEVKNGSKVKAKMKKKVAAKKEKEEEDEEAKKEKKKKPVKEATDAKGGGPLLSKGGNKHDVWKGHADMTYAKGEKGGKGGHQLETLPAKAEHTVTHGGKNLATLGGNKKKV